MSNDYPVTKRSNAEIKLLAKQTLAFYGVKPGLIDVRALVRHGEVNSVFGRRELRYVVKPDHEMIGDDGQTVFEGNVVTIFVKRSVDLEASMGLGRARNTLAHELGHAVMHDGMPKSRRAGSVPRVDWIKSFASAEHQVKVFAPALLIDDVMAEQMDSAENISVAFGVSLLSAKIYVEQRSQDRARASRNSAVRQMADEFIAAQTKPRDELHFLQEPCPSCGQRKLFPVGPKYMCQNCDLITDAFQDGDSLS